jgi:hypothetical protein
MAEPLVPVLSRPEVEIAIAKWKESIILSVHKKGDKTDCNNYHGLSLLSTSYNVSSSSQS